MKSSHACLFLALGITFQSPGLPSGGPGGLSRFESDAGWIELFDGETEAGWRGIGKDTFPERGWDVVDGCLHHKPGGAGGDIVTMATFGDFELEFEWKVAAGANSGVKYMVRDKPGQGTAFGPEYQILDDEKHPNGRNNKTSAGALYAVMPVEKRVLPHVGSFNSGRIVSRDGRIEHWLNGERLFEVRLGSETWNAMVAASKFRGRDDFAAPGQGRIALQDHGDEVLFRRLRLRELPAHREREVELYDGKSLDQWRKYGDAIYTAEGDSILGRTGGGSQSFLISKETFGDFVFEVDVKAEQHGNAGIQIRSHERENGRPFGYQIEIDPSPRSWSGGFYDEARRGWLQSLEHNPAGRAAFTHLEWNRFRIEAIGPWFKVRVNGITTSDYFDTTDIEGFLGLQVHSGDNVRVRWRNPRLWDIGQRDWKPVQGAESTPWTWNGRENDSLELSAKRSTDSALRFPVVKFELRASRGELHVLLQDVLPSTSQPHACAGPGEFARTISGGWCVRPAASRSYREGEWNEVSIGFERDTCALQVNGRSERVVRTIPARNGSRLSLVVSGTEAEVQVRNPMLLSEPRPRGARAR